MLTALRAPQHAERQSFIIGAIDDGRLRNQVLEGLTDPRAIAECLAGSCGREARAWAEARCAALWERLRAEALEVSFGISKQGWMGVVFEKASSTAWSESDRAFFDVMPRRMVEGHDLEKTLDTIGVLDRWIAAEEARLRHEVQERRVDLRSALFVNAYVSGEDCAPGITRVCAQLCGGGFRTTSAAVLQTLERKLAEDGLSPGQVWLLSSLSRGAKITAPVVARALERHWAGAA